MTQAYFQWLTVAERVNLKTPRSWIQIGDEAHEADGAQGLMMGTKLLVMGPRAPAPSPLGTSLNDSALNFRF